VGRRRLASLTKAGLPDRAARPLGAVLRGDVDPAAAAAAARIEAIRAELVAHGDASVALRQHSRGGPSIVATVRALARAASLPAPWGVLLHLLAGAGGATTILELGSCLGISGAYLASAPHCRRFVGVEGTPELARLAAETVDRIADHAEIRAASFDEVLAELPFDAPLDLVYIDGTKGRADNVRWVDAVLPHISDDGLLVVDDIHFSAGMERFWKELTRRPGFAWTLDTGRIGICARARDAPAARRYELFRIAGIDLPRLARLRPASIPPLTTVRR
jgi:predicted O-methyltransferase YrrM